MQIDSFDVIVSLETIEHLKKPDKFLSECKRVLRTTGVFVCSTPNKQISSPLFSKPTNIYHVREYSPRGFFSLINRYFVNTRAYGQEEVDFKSKVKMQVAFTIAQILYPILKGNIVWKRLHRFYHVISREPYLPKFNAHMDEAVDIKYSVIPFKGNLLKAPKTLIAVAKVKESS